MEPWPSKWYCVIWGVLGFLALLSGVFSRNVVDMLFGTVIAFLASSAFLVYYVKSEHRAKRPLEAVFTVVTLVIAIYGYAATGSFLLGILALFMVAPVFFALVSS